MKFGMFFAKFRSEVVVEQSASIYFDPQIAQIAQITPVPSAGHGLVSPRGATPEEYALYFAG